mmetsp:Transcript_68444/g.160547  ORF Transcript_68444/g.160547 Transcript_68444/m.160547 type:complete len:201 (+) Transcript_68444:1128-1730(+)
MARSHHVCVVAACHERLCRTVPLAKDFVPRLRRISWDVIRALGTPSVCELTRRPVDLRCRVGIATEGQADHDRHGVISKESHSICAHPCGRKLTVASSLDIVISAAEARQEVLFAHRPTTGRFLVLVLHACQKLPRWTRDLELCVTHFDRRRVGRLQLSSGRVPELESVRIGAICVLPTSREELGCGERYSPHFIGCEER